VVCSTRTRVSCPSIVIVGRKLAARALVEVGAGAGWAVTAIDPDATEAIFPSASRIHAARELVSLPATAFPPYVVVASQGQWDEEALEGALRRDVAYVGLVASSRRGAAVQEYLEVAGIAPERRSAVRAPCGLDIGAATAGEVAVSILAELIQVRRGRAPFVAMPGPATLVGAAATPPVAVVAAVPDDTVLLDPVCGMTVDPAAIRHVAEHQGTTYAFCAAGCRTRFVKNPARYLSAEWAAALAGE
jgi:xanthine dehydrogenase accessory factor